MQYYTPSKYGVKHTRASHTEKPCLLCRSLCIYVNQSCLIVRYVHHKPLNIPSNTIIVTVEVDAQAPSAKAMLRGRSNGALRRVVLFMGFV